MAKVSAGETVTLKIDGQTVTVKVEDASKSEHILAKVQRSSLPNYQQGQVYKFDRSLLDDN
jgi:hypothetical protein